MSEDHPTESPVPFAWYRWHKTPDTPNAPSEMNVEFALDGEMLDGPWWKPLYNRMGPQSTQMLIEALEWYGENARLCRLIHSEGDKGRHALANDGGKRAREALAHLPTPPAGAQPAGMGLTDGDQDAIHAIKGGVDRGMKIGPAQVSLLLGIIARLTENPNA